MPFFLLRLRPGERERERDGEREREREREGEGEGEGEGEDDEGWGEGWGIITRALLFRFGREYEPFRQIIPGARPSAPHPRTHSAAARQLQEE